MDRKKVVEIQLALYLPISLSYPSRYNQINARKRREETVFRHFVNDD